jgi:hypothetical protein
MLAEANVLKYPDFFPGGPVGLGQGLGIRA